MNVNYLELQAWTESRSYTSTEAGIATPILVFFLEPCASRDTESMTGQVSFVVLVFRLKVYVF